MPTYEYRCRDCGRDFELFQRMSDEPRAPCPECGSRAERLISGGAGLLFKGEGFYITDYRSDAYRERARQESGNGAGADGGKAKSKVAEQTSDGGTKRGERRDAPEPADRAEKAASSTGGE
ncbi:MAG: hypothetical protein OXN18_03155 [Gemmatimonadota bacterium]|nr:hypothetical protein [Gemmatimonadota bacterium]